jgi:hypothetical protein
MINVPEAPLFWRAVYSFYEAFLMVFAICCVYGLMLEFIPKRQIVYKSYAACETAIIKGTAEFNKPGALDNISDELMRERIQTDCNSLKTR